MSQPTTAAATQQQPAGDLQRWNKPTDYKGLQSLAPLMKQAMERGLPKYMEGCGERLIQCLLTETQQNEKLLQCTPVSLFAAAIRAGQMGLQIGGFSGEAYILPYRNNKKGVMEAQLIPGYRGYIQLCHRSGRIRRFSHGVVRQGDVFEYQQGTTQYLTHKPKRGNDGDVTDYYVVVELDNGGTDFETYTYDDALDHRDRYATSRNFQSGPWYDINKQTGKPGNDFHGMAIKTLYRRIAKRLPMSAEMRDAVELDEADFANKPQLLQYSVLPQLVAPEPTGAEKTTEAISTRQQQTQQRQQQQQTRTTVQQPPPTDEHGEIDPGYDEGGDYDDGNYQQSPPPPPPPVQRQKSPPPPPPARQQVVKQPQTQQPPPPPPPPPVVGDAATLRNLFEAFVELGGDVEDVWQASGYQSVDEMLQLSPRAIKSQITNMQRRVADLEAASGGNLPGMSSPPQQDIMGTLGR